MLLNWTAIIERVSTKGPDGKLLSAVTGNESDAELREMALRFTEGHQTCPHHCECPFGLLTSLTFNSLRQTVDNLPRQVILDFFEMEHECRNAHQVQCPLVITRVEASRMLRTLAG
jgi:hypothetical protein